MPKKKLTDVFIKNFETEKRRIEFSDTVKPGLVLRVSGNGSKTFAFRYRVNGKSKRFTIGKYPAVSLSKARSLSEELYIKSMQEIDPQKEKLETRNRTIITISDLAESYKKRHLPKLKHSTQKDYIRRIDNFILPKLGNIEIGSLKRFQIIEFLEDMAEDAPIHSNRIRGILSSMYGFALQKALCEYNPVSTVRPISKENSRDRVYTEDEIKKLWVAFEKEVEPFESVFKMLLITGQRLGETRRMKWEHIKDRVWIIPAEENKANRTHFLPLSSFALSILERMKSINGDSEYVFESPVRKGKPISSLGYPAKRVRESSQVADFRIHDLRRTAASYMAKNGVNRTVLGKVLNHKGLAGDNKITSIYDRHDYMVEKRNALENWGYQLQHILDKRKTKAKIFRIGERIL
ncbi:hypothetical protein A8B79_04335 [Balneola sp. EhC07]|uniref:tyrosine-type recombinase/integrase n=1 Tax=Balneola sp. EhC07 TaxID=1849360 RepID=UPI0007F45B47|nr:site-specific integrase [Balneola sp. EhC07]OAN61661.1 hypothetical protein A8B79_04335 [Balneola sp. EhC07]